jgi:hypothetical protein
MSLDFDRGVPASAVGVRIINAGRPTPIGWAMGIRLQESMSQFPIDVLGDVFTKQHELTRVRVSGSFDQIRIWLKPLTAYEGRPWPQQTNTLAMIQQYLSEFEVYNIHTKEVMYVIEQFRPTDRSITIGTDTVFMENCSFVGRRFIEHLPRLPIDASTSVQIEGGISIPA